LLFLEPRYFPHRHGARRKFASTDALRRRLDPATTPSSAMPNAGIAPLLKKNDRRLRRHRSATAYLPTPDKDST
jgi:hypothetical protein